ncbi:hypothetical protein [Nitrospira sp. KM1]|uniref:hypothetical protein n=1 Tax=Nitrospira sp. KM1 TaxID=1936990 RepID=UPI001566DCE2|nr:hypothetical protein [Nitrospira sp. KM1]
MPYSARREPQRLNVRPGQTTVPTVRGRAGEKEYASPQDNGAFTDSRPSANVALIILRAADLAAALFAEWRVLARRGLGGVRNLAFLSILHAYACYPRRLGQCNSGVPTGFFRSLLDLICARKPTAPTRVCQ